MVAICKLCGKPFKLRADRDYGEFCSKKCQRGYEWYAEEKQIESFYENFKVPEEWQELINQQKEQKDFSF